MIYGSLTDPQVGAIINLPPKNFVIYNFTIYILHPKKIVVYNSSTNWNMVYIWTTNNLLRYININTF